MSIPRHVILNTAVDLLEDDPSKLFTNSHVYLQSYRRVCRAQLRQCFDESVRGTPSSPASFVSLFLSYALTHALTPAIRFTRRSVSSLSVAVRLHTDSLITSRGWAYNGLNFHSPLKTLFRIRFSVCSEPRAELRLQNRGGIGPAHYSKVVQQIRHRRRFSVPRFPQIQNVLGRAGLSREVIDVPVTHERRHRLRDYRGKWYRRLYYR